MPKPTAQAIGRMCLGDGIDLGHTPAAFGMGAKKGTGITREPETAEGSQGPPATLQDPQNTTSVGRKVLPQGYQPCDSHTRLPAPNNSKSKFCPGSWLAPSSACFPLTAYAPCSSQDCWTGRGLGGTGDTVPRREHMDPQFPGLTSFLQALPKVCISLCAG